MALVINGVVVEIFLRCLVETVVERSSKHMRADYAKDQPDCHDDQYPSKHGWDGLDQNLNYQLHKDRNTDREWLVTLVNCCVDLQYEKNTCCWEKMLVRILGAYVHLTLKPWKRDRSLRGPKALRLLKKRKATSVENSNLSAIIDNRNTWGEKSAPADDIISQASQKLHATWCYSCLM